MVLGRAFLQIDPADISVTYADFDHGSERHRAGRQPLHGHVVTGALVGAARAAQAEDAAGRRPTCSRRTSAISSCGDGKVGGQGRAGHGQDDRRGRAPCPLLPPVDAGRARPDQRPRREARSTTIRSRPCPRTIARTSASSIRSWATCAICRWSRSTPRPARSGFLDYVAVHDCGTMVNPMTLAGHVRGGTAQGIGTALVRAASIMTTTASC